MAVNNRDDFTKKTKETLKYRSGNKCSNPECGNPTSGPNSNPNKATSIGVAAHITAAAEGGPRYNPHLSTEERKPINNAIWLCENCAKMIGNDEHKYSVDVLLSWKRIAEENRRRELERKPPLDPKQVEGWTCPFCRSFVEDRQTVCTGNSCHAEVAYSATKQEREQAWKNGIFIGLGINLLFFIMLPTFLNSQFNWSLPIGFGLGFYAVIITAASAMLGATICLEAEERKFRGEPPRFFRNSRI